MKLQRNNKYSKGIATGLSILMLSSLVLSGCTKVDAVTNEPTEAVETTINPTSTPYITIEPTITPEPTPTLEPTPTPEPTPFIRTSYSIPDSDYINSAMEDLEIIDDDESYVASDFQSLLFTKNGQGKAMCIQTFELNNGEYIVKDAFTGVDLFKFTESNCYHNTTDIFDVIIFSKFQEIEVLSEFFNDVNIKDMKISEYWFEWIYDFTKPYMTADDWDTTCLDFLEGSDTYYDKDEHFYTRKQLARYYVTYLPEENRVNVYDLFPELQYEETGPVKTLR